MKDGYYLAAYLHIDPFCHLLNIVQRHDQNMALFLKTGGEIKLVRYWELERVTGMKQHDLSFYDRAQAMRLISRLLQPLGLSPDDLVEIWGTPGLDTHSDYHSADRYPQMAYHNICHLFSSLLSDTDTFYSSNILSLAVDTAPDNVVTPIWKENTYYYSAAYSRKGNIEVVPVESPGIWWGLASGHFQKREGTLMALAEASGSRLLKPFRLTRDFSTLERRSYGKFVKQNVMQELDAHIDKCVAEGEGVGFTGWDPLFSEQDNRTSMAMKEIQAITIEIMQSAIDKLIEQFGIVPEETYLSLSGGYTLNCPTNSRLMKHYKFKGFIAPPCVNDSGISLGMGLFAFYKKSGETRLRFKLGHAFYGTSGDNPSLRPADVARYGPFIEELSDYTPEQVVQDIVEEPVAWFQGASEIGPRALGHRSILGDPRQSRTKDKINEWKQREWWRPVAPIVMEEQVGDWFEDAFATPYMLHTFRAKPDRQPRIQAALHLDKTARVQTIGPAHKRLYPVLRSFYEQTGVPVICNSSLNGKGEPIVDRLEEALNFCLRKGIRVLYYNDSRIVLKNHPLYTAAEPEKRVFDADPFSPEEKKSLLAALNPHGVPVEILLFWKYNLEYESEVVYDITRPEDAERLTKAGKIFGSLSGYKDLMTDFMNLQQVHT
ncbi:carbamoyltransferase C-terminal domain-containing protein [Paenibacillus chitinolyticus]|uniref:carbamoyltransferase C-terminal domain-containing protein n=1 Tax=Paenibacillus chitinolyticus TaxID=79263 RepID=UPI00386E69DD